MFFRPKFKIREIFSSRGKYFVATAETLFSIKYLTQNGTLEKFTNGKTLLQKAPDGCFLTFEGCKNNLENYRNKKKPKNKTHYV